MIYRFLADALVVLHLAFILFVFFGGLLALRWRWVALVHLPAAVWGAFIEFVGWVCPLTPVEWKLREAGGQAAYHGGFVEHYIIPLIYPNGLTRGIQLALGATVLVINGAIYFWLLRKWFRQRKMLKV